MLKTHHSQLLSVPRIKSFSESFEDIIAELFKHARNAQGFSCVKTYVDVERKLNAIQLLIANDLNINPSLSTWYYKESSHYLPAPSQEKSDRLDIFKAYFSSLESSTSSEEHVSMGNCFRRLRNTVHQYGNNNNCNLSYMMIEDMMMIQLKERTSSGIYEQHTLSMKNFQYRFLEFCNKLLSIKKFFSKYIWLCNHRKINLCIIDKKEIKEVLCDVKWSPPNSCFPKLPQITISSDIPEVMVLLSGYTLEFSLTKFLASSNMVKLPYTMNIDDLINTNKLNLYTLLYNNNKFTVGERKYIRDKLINNKADIDDLFDSRQSDVLNLIWQNNSLYKYFQYRIANGDVILEVYNELCSVMGIRAIKETMNLSNGTSLPVEEWVIDTHMTKFNDTNIFIMKHNYDHTLQVIALLYNKKFDLTNKVYLGTSATDDFCHFYMRIPPYILQFISIPKNIDVSSILHYIWMAIKNSQSFQNESHHRIRMLLNFVYNTNPNYCFKRIYMDVIDSQMRAHNIVDFNEEHIREFDNITTNITDYIQLLLYDTDRSTLNELLDFNAFSSKKCNTTNNMGVDTLDDMGLSMFDEDR